MNPLLVAIMLLAGVAIAIFLTRRRNRKIRTDRAAAKRRSDPFADERAAGGDPMKIGPGTQIRNGIEEYFVRGTVTCTSGGSTWWEHYLNTDEDSPYDYISVEKVRGGVETCAWKTIRGSGLDHTQDYLTYGNRNYEFSEQSDNARYTTTGTTDLPQESGSLKYVDFATPDGQWKLSFECYDGADWEVSVGEVVTGLEINLAG